MFPHCAVPHVFFPSIRFSSEETHSRQPALRALELCSTSLRITYLLNLLALFYSIYLLMTRVCQYGLLDTRVALWSFSSDPGLLYLWCYSGCPLELSHWLLSHLPICVVSFWLVCLFSTVSLTVVRVLFSYEHFLTFWQYKMLHTHIFPAPVLEPAISPRSPVPPLGEWYQKQDLNTRCA